MLVIVPTPLGNKGDITLRGQEVLTKANIIYAEDTRVCAKLLSLYDIHTPIARLDQVVIEQRKDEVINTARTKLVAYCTDAGMPGVSDPGMALVAAARKAHVNVDVLPGASASVLAYVSSGFSCPHFYFHGFVPRKQSQQASLFASLDALDACLIFYDSPYRIAKTLECAASVWPDRRCALCRELTKLHQEVLVDALPALSQNIAHRCKTNPLKGEVVFVVDGPSKNAPNQHAVAGAQKNKEDACVAAYDMAQQGAHVRDITRMLKDDFALSRNDAYDMALTALRSI